MSTSTNQSGPDSRLGDADNPDTSTRPVPQVTAAATVARSAPRRVRLVVSRLDPWSMLKMSFLLSVAAGIMLVVATAVLWLVLSGMGVFAQVNELIAGLMGSQRIDVLEFVGLTRVVSLATIVAVLNVLVITALGTIFAFLYNTAARLVGGLTVTLTDD